MKQLMFLVSFFLVACSTGKKCPEVLSEYDHMEGYAKLHLPVTISAGNFEEYVDSKIPDTLYADRNAGGQGVDLEVLKNGRPSMDLNGRTAKVVIPLEIKAVRDLGFLKARADGKLFLTLVSVIDIDRNWELKTTTTVEKVDWEKEPKLKMAGLSLSVKGMIEKMIFSADNQIGGQLDQLISDEQPLVNLIEDLQPQFERAYSLDPEDRYFLQVIPKSAGVASFVKKDEFISSQAVIEADALLLKDSSQVSSGVENPVFEWADNKKSRYDLTAHISFSEEDIEALMREGVIGQEFIFRKKRVRIDQLYFDLQGGKIKVDVNLSGGIKGKVHFEGVPRWNDGKEELEFCDQELDIKVQYGVSRFLLWLFKGQIENIIAKKLKEGINDEIVARITEINEYLGNFRPSEKLTVSAEIYEYAIDPILVKDRRLKAGLNLNVRGHVTFETLKLLIE